MPARREVSTRYRWPACESLRRPNGRESSERLIALCSRWLATWRMGEDAPAAVIRTIAIELPGLPLSSELLHHLIAREAGRLAVDRRCDSVTL
jgi:hypothetical protein